MTDDLAEFCAKLATMSDQEVIAAYEAAEGLGPKGDAAADEMQQRNLDYRSSGVNGRTV